MYELQTVESCPAFEDSKTPLLLIKLKYVSSNLKTLILLITIQSSPTSFALSFLYPKCK